MGWVGLQRTSYIDSGRQGGKKGGGGFLTGRQSRIASRTFPAVDSPSKPLASVIHVLSLVFICETLTRLLSKPAMVMRTRRSAFDLELMLFFCTSSRIFFCCVQRLLLICLHSVTIGTAITIRRAAAHCGTGPITIPVPSKEVTFASWDSPSCSITGTAINGGQHSTRCIVTGVT